MSDDACEIMSRCNATRIRRASRVVTRFYDACLAPAGVSLNQFAFLGHLRHQGPISMGEIARLLATDRTTLSHSVRPLERDGLIGIARDDGDHRVRQVHITRAGSDRFDAARRLWNEAQIAFEDGIGVAEAAQMRSVMDMAAGLLLISSGPAAGSPERSVETTLSEGDERNGDP